MQVIHDQITAHAFSNGTKIQGTAIKKGYIVSVHLNFLVAHFGKKGVDFGLIWDMRVLAGNVPQADNFSKGGVKSTVGILGKLADFLKVGGKIIRNFHGLAISIVQLGNLGVFLCPGKEGGFHFAELFTNLGIDVRACGVKGFGNYRVHCEICVGVFFYVSSINNCSGFSQYCCRNDSEKQAAAENSCRTSLSQIPSPIKHIQAGK